VPHRTTIGRRIAGLAPEAEAQVAALGEHIAEEVSPPPGVSRVSAIDGRVYAAGGPRWHKADRLKGRVPARLRDVDTGSSWSKSGYRGWVQGYRLDMQGLVSPCPVPLRAFWRPNRESEAITAGAALSGGRLQVTGVLLGDHLLRRGLLHGGLRRGRRLGADAEAVARVARLVEARPLCIPQGDDRAAFSEGHSSPRLEDVPAEGRSRRRSSSGTGPSTSASTSRCYWSRRNPSSARASGARSDAG
jgi:hypothetical protein